jgi:Zinc-binding domain
MCSTYEQQHKKCLTWEQGEFYIEEFEDLVLAVVEKFSNPASDRAINHKTGKPTSDHPRELCEACQLGKCKKGTRDVNYPVDS